jgi:hypothetical protein
MIDIAGINALIIWKEKNPDWNQNKCYKRRLFLEELGMSLVSPLLDYRSQTSTNLQKDIRNALALFGYPVIEQELQEENKISTQSKRKRCAFCHFSKDKKTSNQCCKCSEFVCNEHSVKRIFCITCSK